MHCPYIRKIFAGRDISFLPIMVGQVPKRHLGKYGEALKNLFLDERTLFVISSDFCHWGDNFDYKPMMPGFSSKEIYKSIEALDKKGMDLIAA